MKRDLFLSISILFLLIFGVVVLRAIAPSLFPLYFLYVVLGIGAFLIFSLIDFDIVSLFSKHFYIGSILLLVLTLVIGKVTRGTIRWIPVGALTFQPAELVRPFLLVFFANFLASEEVSSARFAKAAALLALPLFLILVQPSLGVAILTVIGFLGVVLSSNFNKRYVFLAIIALVAAIPLFWQVMAPYQKQRLLSFVSPGADPLGAGYNSIQAMIAAGSGKWLGRGLGKGVQTQLAFLPERQTDFIFSSISEELGFLGASLVLTATFIILWRLITYLENSISPQARAYISGFFLTFLTQVSIHVGMNLGLLPITGIPYPLVSAGGSSLLATMIGLGIALGSVKR